MKEGPWHLCGDRSQKIAKELLQKGHGVGVIVSPRDLKHDLAKHYAQIYHSLGAHVLIDQQFYNPGFSNNRLESYPISPYRASVTALNRIADQELNGMEDSLRQISQALQVDGIIAPAVVYEAARNDIVQLNRTLFAAAKNVGKELALPTYATIVLGKSVTGSDQTVEPILSHATTLDSDGWYYAFEFKRERIPSTYDSIRRCCVAGLKLACTGKPVLHAYAGPMSLLSPGFGAKAVGVGHSQNLWRFDRERWEPPSAQGGGGDAPARFFSTTLWGTIIYPDEITQLPAALQNQLYTPSPFSPPAITRPITGFDRWNANKHLLSVICNEIARIMRQSTARERAQAAISKLQTAINIHSQIASTGLTLGDNTSAYQQNWLNAMNSLLTDKREMYEYLELIT
ncbi:MAG: hypothetical protein KAT58_08055 [candidate division Zixibacteria bacterium]|nr:hypothetical protein [candidate division Zixibacteria bacterium]